MLVSWREYAKQYKLGSWEENALFKLIKHRFEIMGRELDPDTPLYTTTEWELIANKAVENWQSLVDLTFANWE